MPRSVTNVIQFTILPLGQVELFNDLLMIFIIIIYLKQYSCMQIVYIR